MFDCFVFLLFLSVSIGWEIFIWTKDSDELQRQIIYYIADRGLDILMI